MPRSKKIGAKTKTKKAVAKKKSAPKKKKAVKKTNAASHGSLMSTLLLGAAVLSVYTFVLLFTSSLFAMAL